MKALPVCVLLTLASVCAAQLYEPMSAPFATWVDNGKPVARIVTDDFSGGTVQPAEMLNRYIERITGAPLPVVDTPEGDAPTVYLGPTCGLARLEDRPDLGTEGFAIISDGSDLIISGTGRLGTLYGVCAFLEEFLGVRWFWDDPLGEHVPTVSTLRVGQIRNVQRPDFRYRWIGRNDWALFHRMNVSTNQPEEFQTKWFVHTFLRLVPPERYVAEHPEYYAMRGGVRADPTDRQKCVQLCTSNPEVAEAAARTIDEILEAEPSIDMISVDPEDAQNFCQCDACRALDEPGAPYARQNSRRLVLFYNRVAELVAEKHPDLLTKSIAYHTYVAPPEDPTLRLHDNVVIQFCRFEGHDHPLFDPGNPKNREFHDYYLGWRKIAKNIIFYEYYYKVSWLHLPWPIVHTLREELPYLRDTGLMGIATQYTRNFATHGLGYYVAAKLLWNADLDVDALVEDYYQTAFAEAATPMERYYERLERAAEESGLNLAGQRPYPEIVMLFTPELMRDLDSAVAEAENLARDPQAKARVEFVAKGLAYTHLVVDYLRTIAQVHAKLPATPWRGSVTKEMKDETDRLAGPKAEAIRAFLKDPANHPAVGGINGYFDVALKPSSALGAWVDPVRRRGNTGLTKTDWLQDNPQNLSETLPGGISLWVYGNDLDFVGGQPEHTILIRRRDGGETVFGHVGTAEQPGDGANRAYVITGIKPEQFADGKLQLVVTNDPGGPFASHFYGFYVLPELTAATSDFATSKIQNDLDWVRGKSLGFTEMQFDGLRSYDGDRADITITIEGASK